MAAPLSPSKPSVDLGAPATTGVPAGSRIRREPVAPPATPGLTQLRFPDRADRDRRVVLIGITLTVAVLAVILIGISSWTGWTPREYVVVINEDQPAADR